MKHLFITLLICGVFSSLKMFGQDNISYSDYLTPSPTASELGKYGQFPISLNTGTPNISIPLYTLSTQNLAIQTALSYYASGVKVDQVASWVGLGWSLNAGGVITRIVRGEPDENTNWPYPDDISAINNETIEYVERALDGGFDTEPDLYSFNFNGISGKFIFDRKGEASFMPHQKLRVFRYKKGENISFMVTTSDGVQYYFGEDASETTRTTPGIGCGKNYDVPVETAWYLTKIIHPCGDTIIFNYTQYSYHYEATVSQTVTHKAGYGDNSACFGNEPSLNGVWKTCKPVHFIQALKLESIEAEGYGKLIFDSSNDREDLLGDAKLNNIEILNPLGDKLKTFSLGYEYSTNPRLFLTSMTEKDNIDKPIKVHEFEYEDKDAVPERLSFDRDYWGYFNGANNDVLVPAGTTLHPLLKDYGGNREPNSNYAKKGMLNKIIYPTGGYTIFDYESNKVYGDRTVYPPKTTHQLSVCGLEEMDMPSYTENFSVPFDQEIDIVFGFSSVLVPGIDEEIENEKGAITILNKADNSYVNFTQSGQNPLYALSAPLQNYEVYEGGVQGTINLKANIEYEIKITAIRGASACVSSTLNYYYSLPTTVTDNIDKGGLRISRISNNDLFSQRETIKKFYYGKASDLNKSSGVIDADPIYFKQYSILSPCPEGPDCAELESIYVMLNSNPQNDIYNTGGNHLVYEYVTEGVGENFEGGGIEHTFKISHSIQSQSIRGDNIMGAPTSNFGWDNGLEGQTRIFKFDKNANLIILKSTTNNYSSPIIIKSVPALVVKKKHNSVCTTETIVDCDGSDQRMFNWVCTVDHKHWLAAVPFTEGGFQCIHPYNNTAWVAVSTHPCFGEQNPEGATQVIRSSNIGNWDMMQYQNLSYWHFLKSTNTVQYDQNGQNPLVSIQQYNYENQQHLQLTYSSQKNSNGDILEVFNKYPDDYDDIENIGILKEKFIISSPIKSENVLNGLQTGGQIIKYNNSGKAIEIFNYEQDEHISKVDHLPSQFIPSDDYQLKTSLIYEEDTTSRIKELISRSQPQTSFLWGYDKTRMIAYTTNASSDQIYFIGFEESGGSTNSRSGGKSYVGNSYTISSSDFNPINPANLVMSYWYWDVDTWKFSGELPFSASISSEGTLLDDIRVYPKNAQMTTYTYNPDANLSSVTDANNITVYYVYDSFGRLEFTKNANGNIVQSTEYNYYND